MRSPGEGDSTFLSRCGNAGGPRHGEIAMVGLFLGGPSWGSSTFPLGVGKRLWPWSKGGFGGGRGGRLILLGQPQCHARGWDGDSAFRGCVAGKMKADKGMGTGQMWPGFESRFPFFPAVVLGQVA